MKNVVDRTFIDDKKASFKPPVLHLYSKNADNKTYFTSQNKKRTFLHSVKLTKERF